MSFLFVASCGPLDCRWPICTRRRSSRELCVGAYGRSVTVACFPSAAGITTGFLAGIALLLPIRIEQLCSDSAAAASLSRPPSRKLSLTISLLSVMPPDGLDFQAVHEH